MDPLSSIAGTGGSNGWLKIRGADDAEDAAGAAVSAVQTATSDDGADVNASIYFYDHGLGTEATAAQIAAAIEGTGDPFAMTANGAGVIVSGDEAGSKIQIWWIDSLLDGDGTDVTTADVQLLVTSAGDLNIDQLYTDQFIV